jgi:hypothetical protein
MARRYLSLSAPEWDALGWDIQRTYLEGMEHDESVPLVFERRRGMDGIPPDLRPREREVQGAGVIDITAMISGLEATRSGR